MTKIKKIKKKPANIGEHVENANPSSAVSGRPEWFSNYENQCSSSSETRN